MLNNTFDMEKYVLASRQEEILRELKNDSLLRQIKPASQKRSMIKRFLKSVGQVMVEFGSRLISKYDAGEYSSINSQDVKLA